MPLEPLFAPLRDLVEETFEQAKADGGEQASSVQLIIAEEPHGSLAKRAQFVVLEPSGPVRVTWNGIASLWAFSQGAARISKRIFVARRHDLDELSLDDDPELEKGVNCLELTKRLFDDDIPEEMACSGIWPDWAPPIVTKPPPLTDDAVGLTYFAGALGWILRHEISHVTLQHTDRQAAHSLSSVQCESEADLQATVWLKRNFSADTDRQLGCRPSSSDLSLDNRGLMIGLGLLWVALFDSNQRQRNSQHPPTAERLSACMEKLGMSGDSAAHEILTDIINTWLTPEERAGPAKGYETSTEAFSDALILLHRHLRR